MGKNKNQNRINKNLRLLRKMKKSKSSGKQEVWMCTNIGLGLSNFQTSVSWTDKDGKFHHEILVKRSGLSNGWFNRDAVNRQMEGRKQDLEDKYDITIRGCVSLDKFDGLYYTDKDFPEIKDEAKSKNITLVG